MEQLTLDAALSEREQTSAAPARGDRGTGPSRSLSADRKARRTDPHTAHQAAQAAMPRAGSQRLRILTWIAAQPQGATYDDVANGTRIRGVSVSTRISELARDGWIDRAGTRETSAGVAAMVWVASARARAILGEAA